MNKVKLLQKLETYTIVTVIAVLVWLYAEGENVVTESATITVQFVSGPEVLVEPTTLNNVSIKFESSTSKLADVRAAATRPIKVNVIPDPQNRDQQVNLRDRLQDSTAFSELRVVITEVDPARPTVRVELLKTRNDVEIIVPPQSDLDLVGPPLVNPAKVAVQVPEGYTRPADGGTPLVDLDKLVLAVRLSDIKDLAAAPKGVPLTREVPVTLPDNLRLYPNITITPPRVTVTLTIRKQTATGKVPSVPIRVIMPIVEANKYEVIPEPNQSFLPEDVELSGPRDVIDKIVAKELPLSADLRLSSAELDQGITSKLLEINRPAGVDLVSPPPRLTFTIKKRAAALPAPLNP